VIAVMPSNADRQTLFQSENFGFQLDYEGAFEQTLRVSMMDGDNVMSNQTVYNSHPGTWGRVAVFTIGRRNNAGTMEWFIRANGAAMRNFAGGNGIAPTAATQITIGNAFFNAPEKCRILGVGLAVGSYLTDPYLDLELLDGIQSNGYLAQVGSTFTHLLNLSGGAHPGATWTAAVGATNATRNGTGGTFGTFPFR
jgi:hypothetical protein